MEKLKMKKKGDEKRTTVFAEINDSLYYLAAYFSEFATVLKASAPKPNVQ